MWKSFGASDFNGDANLLNQLKKATKEKNEQIKEMYDGNLDPHHEVYAVPVSSFKDLVERNKQILSSSSELAIKEEKLADEFESVIA